MQHALLFLDVTEKDKKSLDYELNTLLMEFSELTSLIISLFYLNTVNLNYLLQNLIIIYIVKFYHFIDLSFASL
jgi:hypothetical protein